jgi:hypothetical protein
MRAPSRVESLLRAEWICESENPISDNWVAIGTPFIPLLAPFSRFSLIPATSSFLHAWLDHCRIYLDTMVFF